VLAQQLTWSEEEQQEDEEEMEKRKVTFLDTWKGPEVASKYMYQFVADNVTVMCDKPENELYRIRGKEKKKKKKTFIVWLNEQILQIT
jgi:6-phosphogluconolactonase/glucosamine-6-phosphate isomerase/deaminase